MLLIVLIVGVGTTVGVEMVATTVARNPLTTCYVANTTSTPYDVLERAKVDTQKDCETLCDTKPMCSGISFKQDSATSCVLLSTTKLDKVCSIPTTIFVKQAEGCAGLLGEPSTTIPLPECKSDCFAGWIWIEDPFQPDGEKVFCGSKDLSAFKWKDIRRFLVVSDNTCPVTVNEGTDGEFVHTGLEKSYTTKDGIVGVTACCFRS